uniref:non-specific serine/threonine protein kinase n=1 Tax=Scleropages formosus TaxID=113540 RepID=A0A8C9VE24_SCLFO
PLWVSLKQTHSSLIHSHLSSAVHPKHASTLCSVMAQLTEETQPSFETTLKSKAVSETCNVKFTCVISGYPVPELTWYKDDMEMDRYCGLPKYEIFRDGMTHTLHIYNCTEEDAAIYQASARNNKGIVTCSGILEVGSMNEFKIHQRFFAKLKQKAESKRRELDKSRRQDKENQPVPGSPERMPRKRRSPGRPDPAAPSSPRKGLPGLRPKLHNEEVENMTIELPNSKSAEQGINEQSEGAMSLSQYLATEVHQSQVSEAKQNSRSLEVAMEVETDRVKAEQKQTTKIPRSPKVKSKTKAAKPKEPGPANIQSPLTSVLSSLRGIFFGNKKKNAEETEHYNTPGLEESSTPASPEVSIPNSLHAHETEQNQSLANMTVPKIQVDSFMLTCKEPPAKEVALPVTCCEISPEQRRDSLTAIPAATAEELASGARRKIFTPKNKGDELGDAAEVEGRKEEVPIGQQTPHSPLVSQRKSTLEVPKHHEEIPREFETAKPSNSSSSDQEDLKDDTKQKSPQVIRKIRGEPFSDVSGHLKLWCQFFNVLSDSIIMWFRNEEEIAEIKIRAGDESQVALAVVQASSRDCGVYSCSIKNEYGTDSTDYLLSEDILSEFFLKEDLEVGEEVEMTPLVFAKGLVEPGYWGNKLFGRVMSEELHVGKSSSRKISRMKVIYGLEPVFESGSMCILKVQSPIAYGAQEEKTLTEKNLDIIKQDCKIQNTVREYCKIFSAEVRTMENFGPAPEVMPLYLMYRPANAVPYATVEAYLKGLYVKYCVSDATGRLVMRTVSEVEQKCCAFQHWIHQWTNGNLLVTQLEGVDLKITNVAVVTKSKGYQGLTDEGSPHVFEHFASLHQCNYYCGLLSLRTLKSADSVPQSGKTKASKSPLFTRKMGGMSSPQQSRKGSQSPQIAKKGTSSPKVTRKSELGDSKSAKQKSVEAE